MKVIKVLIILILIVLLGWLVFGLVFFEYGNEQTVVCEVRDKWIKRPSGGSDELYLVNCGGTTYKVEDMFFKGKFNSADIYGNLELGKTYQLEVTGYRIGFFSMYQNINSYKEIEVNE